MKNMTGTCEWKIEDIRSDVIFGAKDLLDNTISNDVITEIRDDIQMVSASPLIMIHVHITREFRRKGWKP